MIDKYIKKALECSRLHSELVDGIMIGEITENKVSELTDQEKLLVQSAWDCIQPFEVRDIVAQQQETITCQKEQIEALIAGQETLQKFIAEKDKEIENLNTELTTERIRRKNAVDAYHEEKDKNQNIKQKRSKSEWGSDKIVLTTETTEYQNINEIKSEAVKEFAERFKDLAVIWEMGGFEMGYKITDDEFDNLVKEMEGED